MAEEGVDAVRIEALARRLKVTKGGFYGHYRDRQALLDAVVVRWEERGTEEVIRDVEAAAQTAEARAEALWSLATRDDFRVELAIRDWARRDEQVREAVARVDRRRMAYLRDLFGDLGFKGIDREGRCLLVYSLLIGDHFIASDSRRYSRHGVLEACRRVVGADR